MVHRSFNGRPKNGQATTSESDTRSYNRLPNRNARDYLEEMSPMNDSDKLLQEEFNEVYSKRERFRDHVSKRMGDLLLLGHTMLDAYCQICNGILMESRTGTRSCVACELMNESEPASKQVKSQPPVQSTSIPQDAEMPISSDSSPATVTRGQLNGVDEAVLMLDKKLSWLAKTMERENDVEELHTYANLLHKLAESLKTLRAIS